MRSSRPAAADGAVQPLPSRRSPTPPILPRRCRVRCFRRAAGRCSSFRCSLANPALAPDRRHHGHRPAPRTHPPAPPPAGRRHRSAQCRGAAVRKRAGDAIRAGFPWRWTSRMCRSRPRDRQRAVFLIGVKVLSSGINASEVVAYAFRRDADRRARRRGREGARTHPRPHPRRQRRRRLRQARRREMTASSDIDLIVVYGFDPAAIQSDGAKRWRRASTTPLHAAPDLPPSAPRARLRGPHGQCLSGQKGPVAAQLSTLREYQTTEAWTWSTWLDARASPARPGCEPRSPRFATRCCARATAPSSPRTRDTRPHCRQKGTDKYLGPEAGARWPVDLEFIAQHLQLVNAAQYPCRPEHPGRLPQV